MTSSSYWTHQDASAARRWPLWQASAILAVLAAATTAILRPNGLFVAAAVMAAGAAGTAYCEARLRHRGLSSDFFTIIAPMFAGAFLLLCVLGFAAGSGAGR
jgi:hypothetical protein